MKPIHSLALFLYEERIIMAKYEMTLGLAKHKSAYFDRATNTSFSIQNKVRKVKYDTYEEVASIIDDLLTRHPSLVYYNGDLPDEFIDEYLKGYPALPEGATMSARVHGEMNMRIISANNMDIRAKELKDQVKAAAEKVAAKKAADEEEAKPKTKAAPAKAPTRKAATKKEEPKEVEKVKEEEPAKEAVAKKEEEEKGTEEQGSLL